MALYEHQLLKKALMSFKRPCELQSIDVIPPKIILCFFFFVFEFVNIVAQNNNLRFCVRSFKNLIL